MIRRRLRAHVSAGTGHYGRQRARYHEESTAAWHTTWPMHAPPENSQKRTVQRERAPVAHGVAPARAARLLAYAAAKLAFFAQAPIGRPAVVGRLYLFIRSRAGFLGRRCISRGQFMVSLRRHA